jgi:hypothetical protein
VERVERALAAFCGEDVADDAALIAVMREGGQEPAAPRPERAVAPA